MKNLISVAKLEVGVDIPDFKDERLKKATQAILTIYSDAAKYADKKNREIAKILDNVASKKAYLKDGFTSVSHYANEVFGINKANAYALATAGRVYNDPNAHPELQKMTPSKLNEVTRVNEDALKYALDKGIINSNTTQKELRAFASEVNGDSEGKETVFKPQEKYTVRVCSTTVSENDKVEFSLQRTDEMWIEYFRQRCEERYPEHEVEMVKLPRRKDEKNIILRYLFMSPNFSLVVELHKVIPPKKKSLLKHTKEELIRIMEEAGAVEENQEVLEMERGDQIENSELHSDKKRK